MLFIVATMVNLEKPFTLKIVAISIKSFKLCP